MKTLLLLLLLFSLQAPCLAQPDNPNNPVPLDGGLSLLLGAGMAFGAKKWMNSRNKE
ncbi:MAG: hypothetical protein LPK45_03340 [Bacteroidota bacterium]|nr:hypothetical protein [Bacteroidota bacterium]MDX5430083.1 hypothetical protein [Bacteroidota bacterium]MDX5468847.1 hypothetical protein [Bacteroidota bacterium]